jgi:hypothetical protein
VKSPQTTEHGSAHLKSQHSGVKADRSGASLGYTVRPYLKKKKKEPKKRQKKTMYQKPVNISPTDITGDKLGP